MECSPSVAELVRPTYPHPRLLTLSCDKCFVQHRTCLGHGSTESQQHQYDG